MEEQEQHQPPHEMSGYVFTWFRVQVVKWILWWAVPRRKLEQDLLTLVHDTLDLGVRSTGKKVGNVSKVGTKAQTER